MQTYESIRLLNNILSLYYVEGLTQTEIAHRLGLSIAKVNRTLQQAREQGYITITIRTPYQHLFEIESRLKAVFGLEDCIVIPTIGDGTTMMLTSLGTVAADYLLEHMRDGDVIGISGGTAVHAVVQAIEPARSYQVEVVPILGAVQGQMTTDMNYLSTQLASRLGGKGYQLNAPAFVDTQEQRKTLLSIGPVKKILDIARRANIALMGVGAVDPVTSRFVQFTALSSDDMRVIAEDCGGVGEIGAYLFDIEGRPCAPDFADRVIGLTLEELHSIPFRIGMAAGAAKALPLFGALRGGHLTSLITDEAAARAVLELFDQNFRKVST